MESVVNHELWRLNDLAKHVCYGRTKIVQSRARLAGLRLTRQLLKRYPDEPLVYYYQSIFYQSNRCIARSLQAYCKLCPDDVEAYGDLIYIRSLFIRDKSGLLKQVIARVQREKQRHKKLTYHHISLLRAGTSLAIDLDKTDVYAKLTDEINRIEGLTCRDSGVDSAEFLREARNVD